MDSEKLKIAMLESEINVTDLAKKVGFTRATFYNKVAGKSKFKKSEKIVIAGILGLGEEQLKEIFE